MKIFQGHRIIKEAQDQLLRAAGGCGLFVSVGPALSTKASVTQNWGGPYSWTANTNASELVGVATSKYPREEEQNKVHIDSEKWWCASL